MCSFVYKRVLNIPLAGIPVVCDLLADAMRGKVALDVPGRKCPQRITDAVIGCLNLELAPANRLRQVI